MNNILILKPDMAAVCNLYITFIWITCSLLFLSSWPFGKTWTRSTTKSFLNDTPMISSSSRPCRNDTTKLAKMNFPVIKLDKNYNVQNVIFFEEGILPFRSPTCSGTKAIPLISSNSPSQEMNSLWPRYKYSFPINKFSEYCF